MLDKNIFLVLDKAELRDIIQSEPSGCCLNIKSSDHCHTCYRLETLFRSSRKTIIKSFTQRSCFFSAIPDQ